MTFKQSRWQRGRRKRERSSWCETPIEVNTGHFRVERLKTLSCIAFEDRVSQPEVEQAAGWEQGKKQGMSCDDEKITKGEERSRNTCRKRKFYSSPSTSSALLRLSNSPFGMPRRSRSTPKVSHSNLMMKPASPSDVMVDAEGVGCPHVWKGPEETQNLRTRKKKLKTAIVFPVVNRRPPRDCFFYFYADAMKSRGLRSARTERVL